MPNENERNGCSAYGTGWAALVLGLTFNLLTDSSLVGAEYGRELACVQTIDKRGIMDAVVSGDYLFVADDAGGSLEVYEGLPGICESSCGNTQIEYPEACDDGNHDNGDGCAADCLSQAFCGDGFTDTANGETCDDGFADDCGTCNATCDGPGTGAGT